MKLKTFCVRDDGYVASEKLDQQVNQWLKRNPGIKIVQMGQSLGISQQYGENRIFLSILYEKKKQPTD